MTKTHSSDLPTRDATGSAGHRTAARGLSRRQTLTLASGAVSLTARPVIAGTDVETTMNNTDTADASRNKAIVRDRFEAWSQGTGSPFELLSDDATWTIRGKSVASAIYPSRESFMRDVIRPFNARMSAPLKPTVHSICADGDTVIVFFDATATTRDGKLYSNTYFWLFEMRDGKVIKGNALFDSIEFNELWSRVSPA